MDLKKKNWKKPQNKRANGKKGWQDILQFFFGASHIGKMKKKTQKMFVLPPVITGDK